MKTYDIKDLSEILLNITLTALAYVVILWVLFATGILPDPKARHDPYPERDKAVQIIDRGK